MFLWVPVAQRGANWTSWSQELCHQLVTEITMPDDLGS